MLTPDPIVSIIIANFNGAEFLPDALTSARDQTLRTIEIIVIDDASSDASVEIANKFAREDDRIRVIARTTRSGPGAARNDGLAVARGQWIAVLDSDDMMHPTRLENLVQTAEAENADICADDLLVFQEGARPTSHLSRRQRKLDWVSAADFIDRIHSRAPSLGYLKPLIRTAFLRAHDIRYKPDLLIGEDYDLVLQLLAKGARFRLLSTLGYFYRKHSNSISHRLSGANLDRMLAADERLRALFPADDGRIARAFDARRSSIESALAFSNIISALKARKWGEAAAIALGNPRAIPLLGMPLAARLRRLRSPHVKRAGDKGDKRVCLISGENFVGSEDASSTSLIAVAKSLHEGGYKITLIAPHTPSAFRLIPLPEMNVFDEVHIRGARKIGGHLCLFAWPRFLIATPGSLDRSIPWHREDQLYIAEHAPRTGHLVLAANSSMIPAIPYALAPSALCAVMTGPLPSRAEHAVQQPADPASVPDRTTEALSRLFQDRKILIAPIDKLLGSTVSEREPAEQA